MLPSAAQTQAPKPIVTPPHQVVDENQQAVFTCLTPGFADCEVEWHFNQVGGTLPPGVYRRGNQVFIPAVQSHHAGNYICTVQHQFGRSESNPGRLEINRAPLRPMVDPPEHNVEVNDPARFRCWVPGVPEAVLAWRPVHGGALPSGAEQRDGFLNFPKAGMHHEGQYICAAHDPRDDPSGSRPVDSEPVRLNIRQQQPTVTLPPAAPVAPQVDPIFQTVDLGQPATIRCWVPGNPNAELKWTTHHHGPLPPTASQHQGTLSFPSVSQADDGGYICSAANGKALVDPPEQTVERGRPARIRCWVPNSPQSRLTWNKIGGQPLPAGARDDGRGNLDIPQTDSHHAGDYECSASDPNSPRGPPQVSDPATISLVQRPTEVEETGSPPRPVATPPVLTVKRGEEARFHCEANSQSKAEIHWAFGEDSGPLRGDTIQQGDDVVISAAEDADQGVYICSATNQFGSGRAEPVRLVVTDDEVPPTARVEPKVWNGKPGDKQQFKCHTTGVPAPDITWSKNGGDLPSDVVDLGDGVLEISNARKEHEGDYTCTATNPIGEASDFGTVSVGESLTVITNPSGPKIIFTVGEPMEIKCLAFGDPDPDVEWLHDPGPKRGDLPDDLCLSPSLNNLFAIQRLGFLMLDVVEPSHLATVAILGGSNQWFPVGQPAQLVCTASGSSLVDQLKWTKAGGGALPSEVEDQNDPGLLHFETFKPSHEGEYECHAYRKDELLATTKVNVYSDNNVQPDKVHVEISPPTVRVVNKGDSIVLDCLVHGELAKRRGHRPILYSWLHGDSDMALYQLTSCPRRILHLQNAQQEHSGLYRVKAKLEDGSSLTSVQPLCWSLARGGSLIRQPSKESQLVVKSADPTNDYGIYRCEVENEEGDSLGSAQVAVAVALTPQLVSSCSLLDPQEAKFDEASEAVLHCPVFVVPGATVSWSKQGDDLPQTLSLRATNLCMIENFDDTASGIYTCSVNYGQSIIEGFVNAKIFVPDTTIKVMLNVSAESVSVGDRVWLDCVVIGDANAQ
uniref:Ig-like domain-containing protein n=1 Tax=Ditylenchus dipsaci TaxID=166011 RepID=A0A915EBA7_9BILA